MGEEPVSITPRVSDVATKDEKFWFYDGSIVLWVEDTHFRVHQTVLSNSSEIFSTLFTLPQPDNNQLQDTIEGCPIVQLHDRSKDFRDLLNALYNPSHFDDFPADAELDDILNFIMGILHLSSKYVIQSLRRKCITLFTRTLPATLEDYDARASRGKLSSKHLKSNVIMRAIRLAQETDVPIVLPFAFYCLARLPSSRILEDKPGDISWQQKTVCLVGRERLRYAEMSFSHSFLLGFKPALTCTNLLCAAARSPHTEWHLLEASRHPHPLRPYTRWHALNVCLECVSNAKRQHSQGRQDVWKCLPAFFEMGTWDELRAVCEV
ncbi:hypothetical protein GYMLUDRAFT_175576 [Collybiopsis luxurians FD-317 M1]|uniref:BTB domain-containing protein n=1 Tax=Collybiopsis luxurians FD-317 M1 TaxID=944289 RepID=A0A0D0CBM5_9AGAR|nr:hypothetical protein GYMLUDRAFT_175576 [Collybiopsis luxurians FD-317 M1]